MESSMEEDGQKEGNSSDTIRRLKEELKFNLIGLTDHPGTPVEDKEQLLLIIHELERQ